MNWFGLDQYNPKNLLKATLNLIWDIKKIFMFQEIRIKSSTLISNHFLRKHISGLDKQLERPNRYIITSLKYKNNLFLKKYFRVMSFFFFLV